MIQTTNSVIAMPPNFYSASKSLLYHTRLNWKKAKVGDEQILIFKKEQRSDPTKSIIYPMGIDNWNISENSGIYYS